MGIANEGYLDGCMHFSRIPGIWLEMQFILQPVMSQVWDAPETMRYPVFQGCTLIYRV